MTTRLHRLALRLLDGLAPQFCVVCAEPSPEPLCNACRGELTRTSIACPRCGRALPAAVETCGPCALHPPPWHRFAAAADYRFPIDALLAALKYRRRIELAAALATLLPGVRCVPGLAGSVVVPVPLHARREWRRGYNQAVLIAGPFARREQLAYRPRWLKRVRHTRAQVSLGGAERRRNLRGAFVARPPVAGQTICLVDDVATTGSTLAAATEALARAGAARVICVVAARAEAPDHA